MSCLRENFTSSSYGEGLETDQGVNALAPRQSFTRHLNPGEAHDQLAIEEVDDEALVLTRQSRNQRSFSLRKTAANPHEQRLNVH